MPVVPTYEDRGIHLDPGLNFRDNIHATGEMFGSQVGEAMGKAGQGLVDVGKAVAEVKELDDTNTAKDSSNNTLGGFRDATYGKNGYMNTTGRAAVEGLDAYRKNLLQLAQDGAKGLSPLAARKYWDSTNVSINSLMDEAYKHAMQERKTWTVQTSKARVDTFRENAAASWGTPNDEKLDVIAAFTEYQHLGNLLDWNKDDLAAQSAALISDVHEDKIRRKAETDPSGAEADIETNGDFLLPEARDRLKATVGKAADDERTLQSAMAFAAGPRVPSERPPTLGTSDGAPAAGPTRQKGFLLHHTASTNASAVLNLDNPFATNLAAMIEDAPTKVRDGLSIAFRNGADTMHGEGRAVDLTYHGGGIDQAPADVQDWLRRNAGSYGLSLPIGGGSGGSVVASTDGVAARALRPSAEAIDKHLKAIDDPSRRDIARLAIMTTLAQQSQQEQQQQQAAKAELWRQVEAGAVPDALPYTIRQAAGSSSMTVARNYVSKAQFAPIVSDDVLLRDMRLFAAVRPEDFSRLNLNDYRDRLGKSDLKALAETQSTIGQDSRKARDEGAELKDAFDMARTRLVNAGALPPSGEETADQRQLLAQAQNAVYTGLADFRAANPKARPTPSDIYKSVDRFVMPYYLPQLGPRRPKPNVKLSDISPDLRTSITQQLAMELDRKPTDGEVAREYAAFRQSQFV
ncbi:hypothetical protein [Pleomorphomonas oryzae]|uniref:hypothetical protein n=1 Tax=Pleomorphomonas oryzae TaxID=261934 RepID=UPI00047A8DC2|nr:hypothetical protein [Pleomorphomonas oryzae]